MQVIVGLLRSLVGLFCLCGGSLLTRLHTSALRRAHICLLLIQVLWQSACEEGELERRESLWRAEERCWGRYDALYVDSSSLGKFSSV